MSERGPASGVLIGRVAVVFGATGWLGAAICRELASAGASVVMVGRNADRLDELQRELGSSDRILTAIADVTSQLDVDDAREAAIARFGHVDLLVVSSGVVTSSAFEDGVPADWGEMIDVNLRGLLHASQTFAEPLLRSTDGGGRADLVLIGAVGTDVSTPRFAVFNAVSAAIKQLARTLRHEYGPRGLRVHIIEPGFTSDTESEHDARRAASPVQPETIAAVVTLAAGLPRGANLAEVLLLPTETA
ncbi:SDR family oxidoreductase [Herbiconiux sp. UC225_62]|uniref:SDR family oxidoreductase n=1 Tax=Herbiconiux sp. UC225_62 TaxID=3350168 RepID=UPI0036D421D8